MRLFDLHLLGSPALRVPGVAVTAVDDEVREFIEDLYQTMDAASGIGLAANQVGDLRRIAVVDVDDRRFAMVNPIVRSAEGSAKGEEGCLSIPDLYADVVRPERIVLEALDPNGQPFTIEADGLLARAIQHEIDHLDGILFIDHLSPLKRRLLVSRWKKDHKGEGVTKSLKTEAAGR